MVPSSRLKACPVQTSLRRLELPRALRVCAHTVYRESHEGGSEDCRAYRQAVLILLIMRIRSITMFNS